MPVTEFTFYGFLPRAKGELKEKLRDMRAHSKLAVVHESPHRVVDLLACVEEVFPHTQVSASCDLTKKHECTLRGTVAQVLEALRANPKADKGEYCLVLRWGDEDAIPAPKQESGVSLEGRLLEKMIQGLSLREAMEEITGAGERKNAVYAAGLKVKEWLGERE
jgi:16S rRNA (cytidine1402-2'-O)-methyltransferase